MIKTKINIVPVEDGDGGFSGMKRLFVFVEIDNHSMYSHVLLPNFMPESEVQVYAAELKAGLFETLCIDDSGVI
tara:strand:- start:95129 stop:95350 length:222 start_codon:yes stop_codon:yes gene_type:complete